MKRTTIKVEKQDRKRRVTTLHKNKSIVGDSIEIMLERIREGEGEEGIADRDLVYNDNETVEVNPLTNIRTDKSEKMLEEKIGEYEHKHRKITKDVEKVVEKENEKLNNEGESTKEE